MTIGIGGWGSRRKPMSIIRAILRSDLTDLHLVTYGGPEVVDEGTVRAVYGVPVAVETVRGVPVVVPMPSYGEGLGEPGGLGRRLPVAEPEEESA